METNTAMRVVVLGGAGNFGARIVRALKDDTRLDIVVASRRGAAGGNGVRGEALDIGQADFAARLAALAPGLVIHCVGPFQGQDYRVAQAALAAGAHYLDLADGRAFVEGFVVANDAAACAAGRVALSGVSTLPALSSAVVEELRRDLESIESIEMAIAPGQRAPRGRTTLEAVFSYLGAPMRTWIEGRWVTRYGWMDLRRLRFESQTRWAAALARAGVPVRGVAVGLNRLADGLNRFGGEWGGMRVSVGGRARDGRSVRRTWQLAVPAEKGPEIPCLPVIVLARRIASGAADGGHADDRGGGARCCVCRCAVHDDSGHYAAGDRVVLARMAGYPLTLPWLELSIVLYLLIGCCWIPVVFLQMRMRRLAEEAAATGSALPATYARCYRWWFGLGWPAFTGVVVIFYLMVRKPMLW